MRPATFAAALAACAVTAPASGQGAGAGRTVVYRIAYQSVAESDLAPLLAGSEADAESAPEHHAGFDVSITGALHATPIDDEGGQLIVAYAFWDPDVRFLADGVSQPAAAERIGAGLARGAFATLDSAGRVVAAQIDPRDGVLAHSTWRTLLGLTQFAVPHGAPGRRWVVEEDDPGGEYRAEYEVVEPAAGASGGRTLAISKARIGYAPATTGERPARMQGGTTIVPDSWVGRYDLDARRLVSLDGSEAQRVELGGRPIARTVTTLRLALASDETAPAERVATLREARAALARASDAVPLSWREPEAVRRAALHRQALGDATLESLLAALAAAEQAGETPPGPARLFRRFVALLALQPGGSGPLATVAAGAPSGSLTFHVLAGALGAAGHVEAQTALTSLLLGRERDLEALSALLPALAGTAEPIPAAEQALRELAFDPDGGEGAAQARLALGIMARTLSRTAPARAETIVDDVITYSRGKAGGERELLAALGNTGSPRALPVIRGHLADSDAGLRRAAVGALRLIPGSDVDGLLAAALSDAAPAVRLEATSALALRQPTPATIDAQRAALARETDDKVRKALQENLTLVGPPSGAGE